jgi:hypothetical protein
MVRKIENLIPTKTTKLKSEALNKSIQALGENNQIVIFFNSVDGVDNLVFAPLDKEGNPDLNNTVSLEVPCPPFCGGGGEVITVS